MPKDRSASQSSWLEKPLFADFKFNWEFVLITLIVLAAVFTRFYHLGYRTMSHDETTHVYFSWQLFKGMGYSHHPLSHGPLQFHLLALSYFLFGDNDFTARVPQALFGVMTVWFAWWGFRRYIGRIGALVASFLFLISPYMLYYSRYARNESFVALFGLVMLWAMLRYLQNGKTKYVYIFVAAVALHFTSKETSFIYAAQALIFLGLLFLFRIQPRKWKTRNLRLVFFVGLLLSASLLTLAVGAQVRAGEAAAAISATQVEEPVNAAEGGTATAPGAQPLSATTAILGGVGLLALVASLYCLIQGYGWERLRNERAFNLMYLLFALVVPHLAAFPIRLLHHDPMDYQNSSNLIFISIVVAACALISAVMGLIWNRRLWLVSTAIFYAIFVPLYTTIFTNGVGFFSGLVGSLGYWLAQQAVQRGSQPPYYYWAVQIPLYEFLAAAGTIAAAIIGFNIWRNGQEEKRTDTEKRKLDAGEGRRLALVLFAFWGVTSVVAFSFAGEKMPWLTVHMALPMLLLAGWSIGWLIKRVDWPSLATNSGLLTVLSGVVFVVGLISMAANLLGTHIPFRGNELVQLQATYKFIFFLMLILLSGYGVYFFQQREPWKPGQMQRTLALLFFVGLALVTARVAFRASYINYDYATEYLVYAHMGPGPKEIMRQIDEISLRTTDAYDLKVAYDNETSYPFWWYLRNYPNQRYYADQPGRDLREFPVIIVGDTNYGKIEPVVGQSYYMFEYNRIWWPNQDYFDFTRSSIGYNFTSDTGLTASEMGTLEYLKRVGLKLWSYVGNAQSREDLFKIWLNRDFSSYLEHKGQDPSIAAWIPSRTMRIYIRKDVASMIWDYGVQPSPEDIVADPYEGKGIELAADAMFGQLGSQPGEFNTPRNLAVAPDGSLYIADANNHRVQHLATDGSVLQTWGTFNDGTDGAAPGGTFNEPWSVAASPDGRYVYVADTWNHRIQKFSSTGQFISMWGTFGQDEAPDSMWGPRDVLVDNDGNVLVTDTGNKRIKVFDANGEFISQYGEFGLDVGQFDEPVGIAIDRTLGRLYVADTWNQRVQVFDYAAGNFTPVMSWDISGWYGQSLTNKPYITVGSNSRVFITDPEAARVLVYNPDGTFVHFFGGFDQSAVSMGVAQGIAADATGVWVTDSQNGTIYHFTD
jgi:uncharacterized protein (TIGR03663 family)